MGSSLLQAVLAAISAGSACSVCGASANSAFLSSYVITHKKIAAPTLCFLAGKIAVTAVLCGLSARLGRRILDDSGLVGRIDVYLLAQAAVLAIALVLTARWIYCEVKAAGACHPGGGGCAGSLRRHEGSCGALALFANGVACGAVPCAPLLIVLSRSAAATTAEAILSGVAFSVTGFLSPVLIWLALSRLLAKQMHREIAQWIRWFQLGCYILLAAASLYAILARQL